MPLISKANRPSMGPMESRKARIPLKNAGTKLIANAPPAFGISSCSIWLHISSKRKVLLSSTGTPQILQIRCSHIALTAAPGKVRNLVIA